MKLVDYPMNCCGIVEASDIGFRAWHDQGVYYTEEEKQVKWDTLFNHIEEHQRKHRRNCAMITLASQSVAEEQAKARGWIKVFEFYNPNSENIVKIYTKVLWQNDEEYQEAKANGYKPPAPNALWTVKQPDVVHNI